VQIANRKKTLIAHRQQKKIHSSKKIQFFKLSAISYQLSAISYQLSAIGC